MSLVLVLSPTLSAQEPYTDLWVWTTMLPQQWSNPDYCYLEPSSRVKPEQPHQMAVSTNHNLGGCVIWLTSYLIDMKITGGFRVIAPFTAMYTCPLVLFVATVTVPYLGPTHNQFWSHWYSCFGFWGTLDLHGSSNLVLAGTSTLPWPSEFQKTWYVEDKYFWTFCLRKRLDLFLLSSVQTRGHKQYSLIYGIFSIYFQFFT